MKKFISAIAAAGILLEGAFGQCVSADVGSLQLETAKSCAEDFVSQYYYSMYTDSEIDLYGRAVYEELADYLSAKLKYQQSICGDVVNFKVYTYIGSVEESEEAFLFNVMSAVTFNYVEADFDSGFTAGNQIMVEKGGECKILDVMIGGGVNDSLLGREKLDLNNCYWEREEVTKEAVAEVCDYIDEVIEEEKIQAAAAVYDEPETYSVNAFTSSVTTSQRNSMVAYANANVRILSPEENGGVVGQEISPVSGDPKQVPEYFDFSKVSSESFDCTNFTSHCLLAGGGHMLKNKWYFELFSDGKGFINTFSWSGVNAFYDYVISNTGVGPRAVAEEYKTYSEYYKLSSTDRKLVNCAIGDIIQIDYTGDGAYDHNVIVVGSVKKDGRYWPAVTGRSGSDSGIKSSYGYALPSCKDDVSTKSSFRVLRLTSLT